MYHYYQRSEHDAWFLLSSHPGEDPVVLAKAQGAKKLTILALNQKVSDGSESEIPRNHDKIGYRGPLYFGIDCKDDLGQAISSSQELVGKLVRMGVPKGCIEIYLSGSKSLHILVNELLFTSSRYTLRLPEIYKEMARDLFVIGLDYSVYSSGRGNSFRIVNLQRHDGNYRVPVTPDELAELTVDRYREWVQAPRQVKVDAQQPRLVHELRALFEEAKKRVNSKPKLVIIASSADLEAIREPVPTCIQMLCDSDSLKADTSYNQAATQLATYIVRARVSQTVAESLASRLASSAKSSTYNTPKLRRDHIEAQIRYVEHTPTFSFGCNAIRSLLSKRPCECCAIEGGANKDGNPDADLSAVAEADGYYIRAGDSKRRISNFTLQPLDVFINVPQDGTSPRRVGTRMNVMKNGVAVGKIIFRESAFAGRAAFLRELEGITDLVFQGTDLDIQKIKIVVFREDQDVGEIFQVYTTGVHLDFVDDSPVFTYVEPDMSVNSVKVRNTHQFLGKLLARPYFAHTSICEKEDRDVDQALFHLLKINQKYEVGLLIGWCVAAHFKTHFMHQFSQFPILCLWGSAGSGKSKTAGVITCLNGTDYIQKDSGVSAPSTSHYGMLEYLSNTTTVPRIIEEFNKSKMTNKSYKDVSERIKQAWNGESTLKGRLGGYVLGRTNAEAIAIPLSAPVIVISEQEIEMPALQERSIRVHLTKMKRKYCREHFRRATEGCEHLRRLGKAIMATSLTTSPEDIKRLMEKASQLLPEDMDDRPRYSQQVVLVGLWMLLDICGQLHLFNAMFVLDTVIKALIERYAEDGDGYVQSEIDLVMQKIAVIVAISRSADEAASGTAYLFDGQHYAITSEYLVLDPVLSHACYTRYCSVDERTAPVIQSGAQFLKLINEEPYFVKYAPHAGMGGGRPMLFLSLQEMQAKNIDISLLGWGGTHANASVI
ncbi:hypothetical protein [Pseudomonas lini]|uniref:DUF927 domain-containing protein n=1 Tax=Pseudomonas lini TaxID=163011 RepID=A0A0J6HIE9_9PSED|nr:hypothetical protein [Pseudomonas lini]KAB0498282.1 hypothetical protein F7R14_27495 [Pseudomonas lini]KMM93485.1 hypothetical protein TU81_11930 [Pseudomonas lini]SDT55429.1 hypothetical protein SAMN04490191_5150 [Pseudomonas lini]